jgi:[ribosomal protein S18]-alanine N-acetyltransferase
LLLHGYQAADLDSMHALDVLCFERPFRFTRSAMRRFAEAKNARVIIAKEGGVLVGFVILHLEDIDGGKAGYIVTLDVAPAQRRRGIARGLMHEAEQQACRENCSALMLHVFTGNESAVRFYTSIGFTRSHMDTDFYGVRMDAWVLHKLLPAIDH